ncbi:hypothetical protein IKP85_01005 [bacterium]|nr:hypothetical protein [bacterium]
MNNIPINTPNDILNENNKYDFHTIPMAKFILISWATFGLWLFRWNYKMWKKVAVDYNYKISPFWRSGFMWIFNFSLFKIIEKHANEHGVKFDISATWLAIIFLLIGFIPTINNAVTDIILYLLFLLPMAYVQYKINEVNKKAYPYAHVEEWNMLDTIWTIICIALRIFGIAIDKKLK